jgi:hypothetical protein
MEMVTADMAPAGTAAVAEPASRAAPAGRVRCPKCQWEPSADSTWTCVPMAHPEYYVHGACGRSWNTFSTRGRCPGCRHQWRNTTCLSCMQISPHKDWYVAGAAPLRRR